MDKCQIPLASIWPLAKWISQFISFMDMLHNSILKRLSTLHVLEMVNYGWRMANGQLLHIFNSVHNYLCYCTFIILVFIFVSCSAKQKISELEAAKAAMKVYSVIMNCQNYNWYFRRVCGLKTVKLLLIRSVKLNFQ